MRHRTLPPGLHRYELGEAERTALASQFNVAAECTDLRNLKLEDTQDSNSNRSGIYFWTAIQQSREFKIYIGRTNSLKRRIAEYRRGFQPHSPNDFKMQVFHQAIQTERPNTKLILYFAESPTEQCVDLEAQLVSRYRPLLNTRMHFDEQSTAHLQKAFTEFYKAGLFKLLKDDA